MEKKTDTLYYDSQCPLCSREIRMLERFKDDNLQCVDIHSVDGDDIPPREQLLKSLHLKTSDGQWLKGIDATVRAWSSTKAGGLWRVFDLPGVRPVADRAYDFWAKKRYQNLYGD